MVKQVLRFVRPAAALLTAVSFQAIPALAQAPGYNYPQAGYSQPPVDPQRLDALVAPIALYPDALLSQVLVACTYPDQLAQAQQFVAQNQGLSGQALLQVAQQQPWDPSIQALVAFPDVIARLNQDPNWTSQLGQAFATDQASVMGSIQRLRQQAYQSGRLQSNSQQVINTQYANGAPVIEIEPANPDVLYVPVYNPAYFWGSPAYGYYPSLWYPGVGVGCYWGSGINVGFFFGGGWGGYRGYGYRSWGGWGGWGWRPNWGGRSVIVNNTFIRNYGFRESSYRGGYGGGNYRGFAGNGGSYRGGYSGAYGGGNRGYNGGSYNSGSYNTGRGFAGTYNGGGNRGYSGGAVNGGAYNNTGRGFSGAYNTGGTYRGGQVNNQPAQNYNGGSRYQSAPQQNYSRPQAPQIRGGAPSYQAQPSYRGNSGYSGGSVTPSYQAQPSYRGGGGNSGTYQAQPSYRGNSGYSGGSYQGGSSRSYSAPSSSAPAARSYSGGGSGWQGGGSRGGSSSGGGSTSRGSSSNGGGHRR